MVSRIRLKPSVAMNHPKLAVPCFLRKRRTTKRSSRSATAATNSVTRISAVHWGHFRTTRT
jgi:hypothetical protein